MHFTVNQFARVLAFASLLALPAGRSARFGGRPEARRCRSSATATRSRTTPRRSSRRCLGGEPGRLRRWDRSRSAIRWTRPGCRHRCRRSMTRPQSSRATCGASPPQGASVTPASGERRTDQRAIRPGRINPVGRVHVDRRQGNVITARSIQLARFPDDVSMIERGLQRRVTLHTVNTLAHELATPWASSCIRPTSPIS